MISTIKARRVEQAKERNRANWRRSKRKAAAEKKAASAVSEQLRQLKAEYPAAEEKPEVIERRERARLADIAWGESVKRKAAEAAAAKAYAESPEGIAAAEAKRISDDLEKSEQARKERIERLLAQSQM